MQRYESYKSSSIPWIDELPQHWVEEKGKWLHRFRKDLNNRKQCDNVLSLTLRGVVNNDPDDPEGLVPKDYGTYQIFEKDDLVFKLIDLENFRTSRVGLVHERGIMSPAYLRVQPGKEHNPRYFYYYYFTIYQQGIYNKLGAGVRSTLGPTDLLEIGVPVPSKDEQDSIVAFLDQKTAEIDAAIAKKERLIELLSNQKKLLIQRAVTRGLTDGLSMRDSGVGWIGDIPSHWSVKRVRSAFKIMDSRRIPLSGEQRGKMISRLYDYYGASGVIDKVDDYLFDEPLILLAEDGANLVMRNLRLAFIASGKYWVNNHAHILKPLAGNMTYLCEALECVDYNPLITGAAQPKLTKDALKGVEIPFPPPEEQSAIASFVSAAEMKYKEIESRFRGEITLLANLKQTTIANVVTGKIRV